MAQDKTVKVSGKLNIQIDGDKLVITPEDGLASVVTVDENGSKAYFYHPLSGWYVELEMLSEQGRSEK